MKKQLNKSTNGIEQSLESYSCNCSCHCGCGCGCTCICGPTPESGGINEGLHPGTSTSVAGVGSASASGPTWSGVAGSF